MTIAELNQRFAVPDAVRFDAGPGGLTQAVLTPPTGRASPWPSRAAVLLHGAHVIDFQPGGPGQRPVLWVSKKSWFQPGKPIRGGVPVCWPWFSSDGPTPDSPSHGFARLVDWQVRSTAVLPDGRATITLALSAAPRPPVPETPSPAPSLLWPAPFELTHTVTVGADLTMELATHNTGVAPFTVTEALHSYFAVSDVRKVRVGGLEGAEYLDTVGPVTPRRQDDQPIAIAAETDRDYLDNAAECVLDDPGWGRRIVIAKGGSRSTVVWNPWIAKAARMADFGDDEWPGMLCIESANVRRDNAVVVAPGDRHVLRACIRVEGG